MEIYTISLAATNKKHKNIFYLPITYRGDIKNYPLPTRPMCVSISKQYHLHILIKFICGHEFDMFLSLLLDEQTISELTNLFSELELTKRRRVWMENRIRIQ
jgi:hypothetical protein